MIHGSPLVMDMANERQLALRQPEPALSLAVLDSLRRRSGQLLIAAGSKLLGQPVAPVNQDPAATPAA